MVLGGGRIIRFARSGIVLILGLCFCGDGCGTCYAGDAAAGYTWLAPGYVYRRGLVTGVISFSRYLAVVVVIGWVIHLAVN